MNEKLKYEMHVAKFTSKTVSRLAQRLVRDLVELRAELPAEHKHLNRYSTTKDWLIRKCHDLHVFYVYNHGFDWWMVCVMEIPEGVKKFAELNNASALEVLLHINRIGNFHGVKPVVRNGCVGWPAVVVDRKVLVLDDFRKIFRRKNDATKC